MAVSGNNAGAGMVIFGRCKRRLTTRTFPARKLRPRSNFRRVSLIGLHGSLTTTVETMLLGTGLAKGRVTKVTAINRNGKLCILSGSCRVFVGNVLSTSDQTRRCTRGFRGEIDGVCSVDERRIVLDRTPILLG